MVEKWDGIPEPPFMSKEYIDRRFDRLKYRTLKNRLSVIRSTRRIKEKREDIIDVAKKIFEV